MGISCFSLFLFCLSEFSFLLTLRSFGIIVHPLDRGLECIWSAFVNESPFTLEIIKVSFPAWMCWRMVDKERILLKTFSYSYIVCIVVITYTQTIVCVDTGYPHDRIRKHTWMFFHIRNKFSKVDF